MYSCEKKWYNKQDVLSIFPIHERTYFRKIKNIDENVKIKEIINSNGSVSKLIHYNNLYEVFNVKRLPKKIKDKVVLFKYIGTKKWDFIGNIVPEDSNIDVLIHKMKFLFSEIKSIDTNCEMFFSIERNSQDLYYHSHFLLNTSILYSDIYNLLSLVCEENTMKKTRKYLKVYDFDNQKFRGSFYSFKFKELSNKKISVYHQYLN